MIFLIWFVSIIIIFTLYGALIQFANVKLGGLPMFLLLYIPRKLCRNINEKRANAKMASQEMENDINHE